MTSDNVIFFASFVDAEGEFKLILTLKTTEITTVELVDG
jgi:hypothetical protein